jgi:hypothetical protein
VRHHFGNTSAKTWEARGAGCKQDGITFSRVAGIS